MPSDEDDDDHDVIATTTAGAATTSLPPVPEVSESPVTIPTDHPQRPTKPSKPGDASETAANASPTTTTSESETSTEASAEETTTTGSSWVPSFLPTFGVSSRTQAWIYGSIGLIVAFCCGLGAWLWWARRKRLRNNPLDKYEFEPLNPDDTDVNTGAGNGEKLTGNRRGGELYDAFAGGSEDEDDLDDLVSPRPRDGPSGSSSDDDEEEEEEPRGERQSSRLLTGGR